MQVFVSIIFWHERSIYILISYYISLMHMNQRGFTLVELMIVIAIIWVLSVVLYPGFTGYMERARVAGIHAFVREMKLKWEPLVHYNYESIDVFGWVPNTESLIYNLVRVPPRFGWPEVSVSWVLSLPMLGQAWYYTSTSNTRTNENIPLSWRDFVVMHWIQSEVTWGQLYTVLNTLNSNWFRFGLGGGMIQVLAWNASTYYEGTCGSTKKINDGRWHHIAGYFQLHEWRITCYYDGKEVSSVVISNTYADFTDQRLMIWNGLQAVGFSWSIDDVIVVRALQ